MFILFPPDGNASYRIEGKVNLYGGWQPKVYLAAIEKLNDYYRASADLVIRIAPIMADGTFVIEGDNLPAEKRFYRLYLMKEQNRDYDACLFVGGDDHNFIHVILDNNSHLKVTVDENAFSPFGNYQITGDRSNQLMQQLSDLVYPSFEFYKFRFPTELKLSEEKLHQDLRLFSDTCTNPLVSLAAVINTDFDEYFEKDQYFYEDFGERLKKELPHSVYTKNYFRKLNYYAFEEQTKLPSWAVYLFMSLIMSLLAFVALSVYLYRKTKKLQLQLQTKHEKSSLKELYQKLTLKEREILALIKTGKSNKEIASQLFVGLSTVKTHINKIYAKLEVKNRKEAIEKSESGGV
jgi:DNA-binding CsgD family transcriptional regulator